MTLEQYIESVNAKYKLGNATEHTFRGLLEQLLESLVPEIRATNEPKRQQCGAPDYIITKKEIPVGFIEAKDIGDKDLEGAKKTGNKEQFDRYKNSLNNLIFTDYLDFHLYIDGIFITKIAIAALRQAQGDISKMEIVALPENFATFTNLIKDFCITVSQTIKSPQKLAMMMAGKARLLSDVIEQALTSDEDNHEDSTLKDQMNAFKEILIHDITPKGFADVYAQTIAYGMFAARLHDPTLPTFSRQEASELIPKSNPFLRKLFGYIAGPDLDDRIKWIVDSLVEIFLACNVEEILKNYGKSTKMEDPIIHFYETFLSEYDPKLRKARGVWYTPKPVVNFIVRAVDDILKTEFDLPQGLADTSKTKIKVNLQGKIIEQEVHKVQILDPATGTGTFLAEVVKHIHAKFKGQQGVWSNYVETHLLPRLNGFELLMASYAMAHLQMDLLLTETGFKPTEASLRGTKQSQRLKIYLTNSLEESHPDTGTLFANWLSSEANEANFIKRDTPVMCIVGNPPYAVSSTNKGKWIESLTTDYKKNLSERKLNLDDDYIKFIRFGQHFIDKNGSGILAYISNNSFINGLTHRQMRKHLLESFDKIYILDLHGNSRIKEVCPDGSADANVFDIMQGVAITIFVKTGKKKPTDLGQVFHYDLFGKRDYKYDFLSENGLKNIDFKELQYSDPNYFFVPKDFGEQVEYEKGFKVDELFKTNNNAIETGKNEVTLFYNKEDAIVLKNEILNSNKFEFLNKYKLNETRDWQFDLFQNDLKKNILNLPISIYHRPFDKRYTFYTGTSRGFHTYSANKLMPSMLQPNIAIMLKRQMKFDFSYCFLVDSIVEATYFETAYAKANIFPLYLYPDTNVKQQSLTGLNETNETLRRVPNLHLEIVTKISKSLGLTFVAEKTTPPVGHPSKGGKFAPIDILDYIYAVLHSPNYREKYKEFLKIDFPKIPYPKNEKTFWELVALGSQIRQIHLLESPKVEDYITEFNIDGDCIVEKPRYEPCQGSNPDRVGLVWINETQHFENVPEIAWNFYSGGYQPAQKWLKDRKGRKLEFDDIAHYQKIIVALSETYRIMKIINEIEIE